MAKDFKNNPSMSFISQESIDKVDGTAPETAPAGYKINPEYIETKSRRVQVLVQPSVYEEVKARAKAEGISTNEAINNALRKYIER